MKVKDFYLIESLDISILDESQKKILDKLLVPYHQASSVIERATSIDKIVMNNSLGDIMHLYNEWLFKFVTEHLNKSTNKEKLQPLLRIFVFCHQRFGKRHFYKGEYDEALNSYHEAIKILKDESDKELLLAVYCNISSVYYMQGKITYALETYEKAAPLLPFVKNAQFLGNYYMNFGSIIAQQGNYLKAIYYFYKSLKIFEENNLENDAADVYKNIGNLMYIQNDLEAALKYHLKALKISQKFTFEIGESWQYTNIGNVYKKKKEYEKAFDYYEKALEIQLKLKLKDDLAECYLKMAELFEIKNQLNLALGYYDKSLQLSKKIGAKQLLSEALSKKGALEIKTGITEKTKEQIQLGFSLAIEIDDPLLIRDAAITKVNLALAEQDYKLAYEMECLKNEMREKIQNEDIQKKMITQKYEYESKQALGKKDEEIELEKENARIIEEQSDLLELKNEELANKNKIINKQVLELEDLIQKLQESNESLNQFAAVAAHDLKAPLRNILGFSQLLHKKFTGQLPEKDMVLFMHIINSCASLKELIDGLLNYSKISNVKLELDCVDLSELVADVKNNLSNIIQETKVVLHIADSLPKVTGQYSLLFQVVLNFINNAIKFRRKEGGLQSEIWVISEFHNENQIKISIKDNGIGIEKEYQNKIFGIFKKLHSSSEYEGSGIGLSVCKKIIERLGGKVWLESEKNVGTTFFFTLKQYS